MALIDSVVDIRISRNTLGIKKDEFSTIFVIGTKAAEGVEPKLGVYTSLTEVLVDYDDATPEYAIAVNIFSQEVSVNKIIISQRNSAESFVQTYNRIAAEYSFYAVLVINKTAEDPMPLATVIEASRVDGQSRILGLLENDNVGLGLMVSTHAANLTRTFVMYNTHIAPVGQLEIQAPAAWMGALLPTDPGSATWAYKTLKGVIADTALDGGLTSAKITAINNNKGNFYTSLGGRDVTFNGTMASGEYIDIIYGIDWLENQMQQDVFNVYVTNPKVPYTNQGISLIETAMRGSLELALTRGVISSYKVTTPDITTVSFDDKANRDLKNVTFQAIAMGAIHHVFINGYVTL